MDDNAYNELVARLNKVNKTIGRLDPAIRVEAFKLFVPFITKGVTRTVDGNDDEEGGRDVDFDTAAREFLSKHDSKTPSKNVKAIVAFLYSQYGAKPMSIQEIKAIADSAGIIIPERPGATLNASTASGKPVYTSVGSGQYRLTINGERYFNAKYDVRKGTKPKPAPDE